MVRFEPRILSRPHRVLFAGWETTTTRLQQAGWSLSAEEDLHRMTVRLALRLEPARLYMLSETASYDYYRQAHEAVPLTFHVRRVASDMKVVLNESLAQFQPIDAMPQVLTNEARSIEDLRIFATPLARTDEIIVEPSTVMDLLEKIKAMQAPDLAAIRERNRRRFEDPGPAESNVLDRRRFHAQIVSLAA